MTYILKQYNLLLPDEFWQFTMSELQISRYFDFNYSVAKQLLNWSCNWLLLIVLLQSNEFHLVKTRQCNYFNQLSN